MWLAVLPVILVVLFIVTESSLAPILLMAVGTPVIIPLIIVVEVIHTLAKKE